MRCACDFDDKGLVACKCEGKANELTDCPAEGGRFVALFCSVFGCLGLCFWKSRTLSEVVEVVGEDLVERPCLNVSSGAGDLC